MSRTLSPQKDDAILSSAVELLLETGYTGLNMEAVATRAVVSNARSTSATPTRRL